MKYQDILKERENNALVNSLSWFRFLNRLFVISYTVHISSGSYPDGTGKTGGESKTYQVDQLKKFFKQPEISCRWRRGT